MGAGTLSQEQENALQVMVNYTKAMVLQGRHEKVSLEEIVHAAGLPQEVIGKLIPSKEELVRLVVSECTKDVVDSIFEIQRGDDGAEQFLRRFAVNYLARIVQPDALKAYRLAASQAAIRLDIAEQFRETALNGYERLAQTLEKEIKITLPEGFTYLDVSHQFHALCRGAFHHLRVFSPDDPSTDASEVVATARKAVATFLRAFPLAE